MTIQIAEIIEYEQDNIPDILFILVIQVLCTNLNYN